MKRRRRSSKAFDMHDLITKAMAEFTPNTSINKLLNLNPHSTAILPVRRQANDTWVYEKATSRSSMPAQFRRYAEPAAEASDATGLPHAFLAATLLTYRFRRGSSERRYSAPLILTPAQLSADESYITVGAPVVNEELREALQALGVIISNERVASDPNSIVIAIDPQFRCVLTLNLAARKMRQLLEPAASGSASPALERLLQVSENPCSDGGFVHEEAHVRRLDRDQKAAFEAASRGLDLCIFGPPGCGKSDVLAAVARAALDCGRRVLICSTVVSAIDVARRRLVASGHGSSPNLTVETVQSFANNADPNQMFDLVLIDEATRMTVSEGLVVSSRGRQLIICGDPHQMQPANERQSIYDQAMNIRLPVYRLGQHYRSRDPHLIDFSNFFSYDLTLRTERSPDVSGRDGIDLIVVHKPEIEARAGGNVNVSEANVVAHRLLQHIVTDDPRTIGVIALTRLQAGAIKRRTTELLAVNNLDISALDRHEPFFVRTTDAVQGEERDVILVSLALGPINGDFDQKFGPLTRGDALKRMNVVLTRARSRCEVITSLLPHMIQRRGQCSKAGAALGLALRTYNALLTTDIALPPDAFAEALLERYRRPGDALDNLGIVTGWRPSGSSNYVLGILGRSDRLAPETWDAAIAHLRAIGWTLIVYDEATFDPNDPDLIRQMHDVRQRLVDETRHQDRR